MKLEKSRNSFEPCAYLSQRAKGRRVNCAQKFAAWRFFGGWLRRAIGLILALYSVAAVPIAAQESVQALVSRTIDNENLYRASSEHFSFVSRENSARTGGHAWIEKAVEIESGVLRRLVAVDGIPISEEKARAEDRRISNLAAHPDEFRKANKAFKSDEKSLQELSRVIPRAFTFTYDGSTEGCTRIRFEPNPTFVPSTYEQRVMAALAGTILIKEPDDRLCGVDARISHAVVFGYGLFGRVDENGRVHVVRVRTSGGNWQASLINLTVTGRVLVFRSITQSHDEVRTEIKDIPANLTLVQAAELTRP
jgi:hypothetical protein